jgi:hypothetical protein
MIRNIYIGKIYLYEDKLWKVLDRSKANSLFPYETIKLQCLSINCEWLKTIANAKHFRKFAKRADK